MGTSVSILKDWFPINAIHLSNINLNDSIPNDNLSLREMYKYLVTIFQTFTVSIVHASCPDDRVSSRSGGYRRRGDVCWRRGDAGWHHGAVCHDHHPGVHVPRQVHIRYRLRLWSFYGEIVIYFSTKTF